MATSLREIEAMIETLGAADRYRLLQYLVPRLAAAPHGESLTRAVSDMRR